MRVLVIALLPFACGAPQEVGSAEQAPPVNEGSLIDWGDLAVGLVWIRTPERVAICTGTLIAPDTVLTAAHCVKDAVDGFYLGLGNPEVDLTDPTLLTGREGHGVDGQRGHPDWNDDCTSQALDLGVLHLAIPITHVDPLPLAATPPSPGDSCNAIGFGLYSGADGTETLGQKRTGTEVVSAIQEGRIVTAAKTNVINHGDSGGPLICHGEIAGAVSCADARKGIALYARADVAASWINQTASELRRASAF